MQIATKSRGLEAIERFARIDLGRDLALCEVQHILMDEAADWRGRRGDTADQRAAVTASADALIGMLALEAWAERHDHLFHFYS